MSSSYRSLSYFGVLMIFLILSSGCLRNRMEFNEGAQQSVYRVNQENYIPGIEPLINSPAYRARVHTNLASAYYSEAQYGIALEELRRALSADRNYAHAHSLLGIIYFKLGDKYASAKSFRQSVKLAPSDPEILNNYAWFACQDENESIELYQQGLKFAQKAASNSLYVSPEKAWQNVGQCAERLHLHYDALNAYKKSYQLQKSYYTLIRSIQIYEHLKMPHQVKSMIHDWLESYPNVETEELLLFAIEAEKKLGGGDAEEFYRTRLLRFKERMLEHLKKDIDPNA